jgi:hypothetical protein
MQISQNDMEAALFSACTCIKVGDGHQTKFWLDRWLQSQAPQVQAPDLYKLAMRKNITIAVRVPSPTGYEA